MVGAQAAAGPGLRGVGGRGHGVREGVEAEAEAGRATQAGRWLQSRASNPGAGDNSRNRRGRGCGSGGRSG